MVDFVKIEVPFDKFTKSVLNDERLFFEKRVSPDGLILSQTAKFKNMDLRVEENQRVIIEGSIHKFWNGNDSNGNDFPQWALRQSIEELAQELCFSPKDSRIVGLEYGVNIVPPINTSDLINRMICYDWRVPFESLKGIKGRGNGKQANLSNYRIKGYDKGLQEGAGTEIFRLEVKTLRSEDLMQMGVNTLHDLCNGEVLEKLGAKFHERIGHIFFKENLELSTSKEELFGLKVVNPNYWKELSRWKRNDEKQKLLSLIERKSKTEINQEVQAAARQKWETLQKCNVFAWFWAKVENEKCNVFASNNLLPHPDKENEKCNVFALLKSRNVTLCQVSGIDISGQKKGSKFVSAKTIKSSPDLIDKLGVGRKKNRRKHSEIPEEARIAKRLRNQWSNTANNVRASVKRLHQKGNLLLFPLAETISPNKLEALKRFEGTEWDCRVV